MSIPINGEVFPIREAFDRGDKFVITTQSKVFRIILIAQHRPHLSQFVKHGDGFWMNLEYNDLSATVELQSVPCRLALSAIYRNISFAAILSESETV